MAQSKEKRPRSEYSAKLRDPRWQKLRLQAFERDEWTCQICYDTETTLAVHHKYYLKDLDPWEYSLEALVTLCEPCHNDEYEGRPESEKALLHALREKGFFAGDVQNLAIGFHKMPMLHLPEVVATAYEWALKTPEVQRQILSQYFEHLLKKGVTWHLDLKPKDK